MYAVILYTFHLKITHLYNIINFANHSELYLVNEVRQLYCHNFQKNIIPRTSQNCSQVAHNGTVQTIIILSTKLSQNNFSKFWKPLHCDDYLNPVIFKLLPPSTLQEQSAITIVRY